MLKHPEINKSTPQKINQDKQNNTTNLIKHEKGPRTIMTASMQKKPSVVHMNNNVNNNSNNINNSNFKSSKDVIKLTNLEKPKRPQSVTGKLL